jgi:glycosyltransferase involved in cell wall biosynthesis
MTEASPLTVSLLQTSIGDYRQAFLEILIERLGDDFDVYAGTVYFDGTTRTRVRIGSRLHHLGNHYLLGRRLLWQSGAVSAALKPKVAVLEYNPRIVSVWASLLLRRALHRRTILWGHAWSRKGAGSRTNQVRSVMRWFADGLIVYTRAQADDLLGDWPERPLFVAPNAMYRREQLQPVDDVGGSDFLYVGRLTASKRPKLLLEAFGLALDRLPATARLVFVGGGPMDRELRKLAESLPAGRVAFEGHVADPDQLRVLYGRALASVSPGPVGLSITQSLGFGIPMLIARDEPHGPEVEAAIEGFNAMFFAPSTAETLAEHLVNVTGEAETWRMRRAAISEACRTKYSAEAMADGFIAAVEVMRSAEA